MSVKGKLGRGSLGQTMPVHAEPLGFTNASFRAVNQVTFSYRTNTEAAAVLPPTEMEIDENPKISVMFLSYGFSSVGPFREYIHIIHARFRGEEVGFVPHIFISNERGMLAGREREGYPKLLGDIDFDMHQPNVYGLITAQLSRPAGVVRGHANRRVSWTYLSAPPVYFAPGQRTGKYRSGLDHPVEDATGRSSLSYEDFAVATIDEVEQRKFINKRFTVGY
jgi:hypothetical protein